MSGQARRRWWTFLQLGPYLILSGALIIGALVVGPSRIGPIIVGVGLLAIGWIHVALCVSLYASGYWRGRHDGTRDTVVEPRPWDAFVDDL